MTDATLQAEAPAPQLRTPSEASQRRDQSEWTALRLLGLAAMLLLAIVVTKDAWLSDDAFITLRTIDNFWNGYGLRWNAIERVQPYTHPLWMLLLAAAYGVTREPQFTTLAVSLALTAALGWLLLPAPDAGGACLCAGGAGWFARVRRLFDVRPREPAQPPPARGLLADRARRRAGVAPPAADARDAGEPLHVVAARSGRC